MKPVKTRHLTMEEWILIIFFLSFITVFNGSVEKGGRVIAETKSFESESRENRPPSQYY